MSLLTTFQRLSRRAPTLSNLCTFGASNGRCFTTSLIKKTRPSDVKRLLKFLPTEEKKALSRDLRLASKKDAVELAGRINKGENVAWDGDKMRQTTVLALKALKMNLITLEQLASIHLIDGATRDLVTHPYLFYTFEGERSYLPMGKFANHERGTKVNFPYNSIVDQDGYEPALKRFFCMTNKEWKGFCSAMESAPFSEKRFYLIPEPEHGTWSAIVPGIQNITKLCHPITPREKFTQSLDTYNFVVVPSFSIWQHALNEKISSLGQRKPPRLQPTYGLSEEKDYLRERDKRMPLALYFPESDPLKRYNNENEEFRRNIDGFKKEGPYAASIHDVYHLLRIGSVPKNITDALAYMVEITQNHSDDQISSKSKAIYDLLADGELIYCCPPKLDTCFDRDPGQPKDCFGDILEHETLISSYPLKEFILKDMVLNKAMWRKKFQIGKEDLLSEEQEIYTAVEEEFQLD